MRRYNRKAANSVSWAAFYETGAGNESRTRDLNLGKVALYQLSYSRIDEIQDYRDISETCKSQC